MPDARTIHVVDDDEALRASLQDLFESVGYRVRTYPSTADFLAADLGHDEACLILDVRLPGMGGLELQQQLVRDQVKLPVILVTGFGDIRMSVQGMKAGAIDFLEKPFRDQDMLDAVASAFRSARERGKGGVVDGPLKDRHATLSPRERQVMALVTAGLMNKQVAAELSISEVTVKIHRSSAMRKMGAKTFAELVRIAEALGIGPDNHGD
jgi:FixJ family two-component response regulator